MNYIYENILKPILQILERFFVPKNSKEFVVIINFLDLLYEKGGNFINNLFFIILFPVMFFPFINLIFMVMWGVVITMGDFILSFLPVLDTGSLWDLITYWYFIEIFFTFWNLFLFGHYTYSGMLRVRLNQTKSFFKNPFKIAYDSNEFDLAYRNYKANLTRR